MKGTISTKAGNSFTSHNASRYGAFTGRASEPAPAAVGAAAGSARPRERLTGVGRGVVDSVSQISEPTKGTPRDLPTGTDCEQTPGRVPKAGIPADSLAQGLGFREDSAESPILTLPERQQDRAKRRKYLKLDPAERQLRIRSYRSGLLVYRDFLDKALQLRRDDPEFSAGQGLLAANRVINQIRRALSHCRKQLSLLGVKP